MSNLRQVAQAVLMYAHDHDQTPSTLPVATLNAERVLGFLKHMETERHDSAHSRNARLAAIRSFVHYLGDLLGPVLPEATRRILTIPSKRLTRPLVGFLTRPQIAALLRAPDDTWTARRNHLLLLLLYNTGARISEITPLQVGTVRSTDCRQVLLQGKGRKERVVPLWAETRRALRRLISDNRLPDNAPPLPNRFGQRPSRSGVTWHLDLP